MHLLAPYFATFSCKRWLYRHAGTKQGATLTYPFYRIDEDKRRSGAAFVKVRG